MAETPFTNLDAPETLAPTAARPLPPVLAALLGQLKARIRRYLLLEGTALVVVVLLATVWLTLGIDWAYFRLTGLELPIWFRDAVAVCSLLLAGTVALFWIGLRLVRRFRARALALVLGRRVPENGSRLISAVRY